MKGFEQQYEIITQDLKSKTAYDIVKRNKTETVGFLIRN